MSFYNYSRIKYKASRKLEEPIFEIEVFPLTDVPEVLCLEE